MRFLIVLLAFIGSLVVTAAVTLFAFLFLAGPHGGALPTSLHGVALAVGWLVVIAVPTFVTRWAWRRVRLKARAASQQGSPEVDARPPRPTPAPIQRETK
jgi:fructose-specific phosphotransferase system IIC component